MPPPSSSPSVSAACDTTCTGTRRPLRLRVHHPPWFLRTVRYHWFWTSAFVGVGTIFLGEAVLMAVAYIFYLLTAPPEAPNGETSDGSVDRSSAVSRATDQGDGSSEAGSAVPSQIHSDDANEAQLDEDPAFRRLFEGEGAEEVKSGDI